MTKKNKKKEVEKMLSPEEQTILSNIQSLVGELLTPTVEQTSEMEVSEGENEDSEMIDTTEENNENEVEKGLEDTPSDSSTASDDNEERIDETQTPMTEENVGDVAKALIQALSSINKEKKPVVKSELGQLVEAVSKLVEVQKSQNDKVKELETGFVGLLDGLGVTKQLEIAEKAKPKPVVTQDNDQVLKAIASVIGKSIDVNSNKSLKEIDEQNVQKSNSDIIRNNLRDRNFLRSAIANKM